MFDSLHKLRKHVYRIPQKEKKRKKRKGRNYYYYYFILIFFFLLSRIIELIHAAYSGTVGGDMHLTNHDCNTP